MPWLRSLDGRERGLSWLACGVFGAAAGRDLGQAGGVQEDVHLVVVGAQTVVRWVALRLLSASDGRVQGVAQILVDFLRFSAVPVAACLDGTLVLQSYVSHVACVQIPVRGPIDALTWCPSRRRRHSAPFGVKAFDISAYFFEFTWLARVFARFQLERTRRMSL